jgi:glycine/D-amino acid oxidase-like deaminating enzyme/nitrite reductase/ring-hydroxylating ferredoxin subunit
MTTARTLTLWDNLDDLTQAHFQRQPSRSQVDVIVVGAGIAGLTTALMLREQGREVTIVDRAGFGGGESLRTTAHLASALDDRYYHLQRWHGRDGARVAAQSHAAAIDWIEQFCHATRDCDFVRVPGLLFAHDGDLNRLRDEAQAARDAGINARLLLEGLPDWPQLGPVLEFSNQARVDMGQLMRALAEQAVARGVDCLLANATEVEGGPPATVTLEDGRRLDARAVVVATHTPFHERVVMHTKQAAYRTYVVAAECARDELPDALVWDDADPYHYVRWVADRDDPDRGWAIVGGEDHKTGQDADPSAYVRLQEWASARFPALQRFTHAWSGQIIEPSDGLAYIGADPGGKDHVYLVTGDSGNGVTHGVIAGLILSELVQGREHPWADVYDPSRKPVKAGASWMRENANVAAQYTDWVAGGDVGGVEEIALGEGAILRRGLQRLAVYRSGDGALHSFSARCPHLGCAVRWSPQEKSWDCPCHGSRFDAVTGAVLNGPAQQPLSPAEPGAGEKP